MTYEEALAFIHGTYGLGKKNGLENMHALLAQLGNPQDGLRMVHIGGTNGKGSTCAFVQAALRCAGYRTGLYTSPFLQRYNERMRIDGVPIPDDTLAALTGKVAACVEMLHAQDIFPTEFEIGTAIALLHFAEARVDVAVIEVGLGGRFDPTNVIVPLVSAIAAIGIDHTRALGDTMPAIAAEKAGIAKPGVPLVLSAQNPPEVREVVAARCAQVGAPFSIAAPPEAWALGIPGAHQQDNAALAVAVLRLLRGKGFSLPKAAIAEGLRRARWPGRLEWIGDSPPLLLDGAHNGHGARALAAYVRGLPPAHTVLLCGILRDKDYGVMVDAFSTFAQEVVAVSPDSHRALEPPVVAEAFTARGVQARVAGALADAVDLSRTLAGPEGRVVIAGSLYLVGEARGLASGGQDTLLAPA